MRFLNNVIVLRLGLALTRGAAAQVPQTPSLARRSAVEVSGGSLKP